MRIRKSSSSLKPPSSGTAAGAGSVASFSLFSAVSMRHYFNRLAGNRPLYRCSTTVGVAENLGSRAREVKTRRYTRLDYGATVPGFYGRT